MAQEVHLMGATYSDVPSILLPDSNNTLHSFVDATTVPYLPPTYQRVEYLGTTQNCYIYLGARSYASFGFEVTYYLTSRYASNGPHLISDNTGCMWFVPRGSSTMVVYGGTQKAVNTSPVEVINYARLTSDGTTGYCDVAGIASATITRGSASLGNMYLFCYGGNTATTNYQMNGRLYSLRFYNAGTVVENFIPCYRVSDSVPGLYESVNQIFYTNSGSGSFTVGSDVA